MPLVLLDFNDSPRDSFRRGVTKGLAAPLMLFASNAVDLKLPPPVSLPKVLPVKVPESLRVLTDAQRIGMDFNAAVGRHEETGQNAARDSEAI